MSRSHEAPRRQTLPVTSVEDKSGRFDESHPAFGVAVVTRGSGTGRPLFQSDMLHNETITLSIHTATRRRDLNHDWVHPEKELVEVELSLAQWGALVSSIGIGSGVPVTIRRTESEVYVANLPYEPRIQVSIDEVHNSFAKTMERIREAHTTLNDAIEQKRGAPAIREARRGLASAIEHVEANAEFAVKSMKGAAEKITAQARADIEAQILSAQLHTGTLASIEMPVLGDSSETLSITDGADGDREARDDTD